MLSFKNRKEFARSPFGLPESLSFENYITLLNQDRILLFLRNSIVVSIIAVVIVLVTSILAGYALARLNFKGQRLLLTIFLIGDTIPLFVVIIPLFIFIQFIGLANSRWALILTYAAMSMGLAVYMMRGFFRTIMSDMEDAAIIDGCSTWQLVFYILLPLIRPGATVVAIITFISFWNEYFLVQVLMPTQELFTLPAGMAALFMGRYGTNWPVWGAGIVLSILPIITLFTFAQDKIVEGFTYTGK